MDEVTTVKKYLKKEQWKQLISECQSSGMSVRDWCSLNHICEQTYYRNLRKLREEICEQLPVPVEVPEKPVAFKRLEITSPIPNTHAAVIIRLPQATLEIAEGTSQQTIQAVLLALQSVCQAISQLTLTEKQATAIFTAKKLKGAELEQAIATATLSNAQKKATITTVNWDIALKGLVTQFKTLLRTNPIAWVVGLTATVGLLIKTYDKLINKREELARTKLTELDDEIARLLSFVLCIQFSFLLP